MKDEYDDRKVSLLAFLSLLVPWGVGGVPSVATELCLKDAYGLGAAELGATGYE